MDCEELLGQELGSGKYSNIDDDHVNDDDNDDGNDVEDGDDATFFCKQMHLSRAATSTWSMGKMCAVWQKVLCMLKFEDQK